MNRRLLTGLVSTAFLVYATQLIAQPLPLPTDPATACGNPPGGGGGDGGKTNAGCDCPGGGSGPVGQACTTDPGSVIDNTHFNHRHFGFDYNPTKAMVPPVAEAGCASCALAAASSSTTAPKESELATLERVHSLRDCTYPSSLGPGVFLKDDKTLSLSTDGSGNTSVIFYNPEERDPKQFTVSGSQFVDTIYNSAKGIVLYDVNGVPTVTLSVAVRAQWVGYDGKLLNFEIFPISSGLSGGRITSVQAAGGRTVKTYVYSTPVSAASTSPSSMWAKSSIADAYGHTLSLSYTTLSNGAVVLSSVALPASRQVVYSYDSSGNLASVALPSGDITTINRIVNGSFLNVTYTEATERPTHRNKTVSLSNNIAASTISSHPLVFNQSSQLIRMMTNGNGEMTYWNTSLSGTGHRYAYSGGGTMRTINNDDAAATLMTWSVASGKTGWSSITNVVQAQPDNYPSYENPANLKGQPSVFHSRTGVVHTYGYDFCGNMTSDATSQASQTVAYDTTGFNKPLIDVDQNGNAVAMAYDGDGNMISRTKGLVAQVVQSPGQTVQGLVCTLYSAAPTSLGAISASSSATVTSTFETFGFESPVGASAMLLQGNLTLATAGVRTFNLGTSYYGSRLVIDGNTISTRYYTQSSGAFNVNLAAGVHTISVYTVGGGRPTLTWSGPETTNASGLVQTMPIGVQFLSHAALSGETVYVSDPSGSSATENWTYYTSATLRDLMQSYTDGAGKVTQYAYDSNRRLTQVQETGDNGSLGTVATYTYDTNTGDLLTATDAIGRTVTYAYDLGDRLIKTSYGDGTTETVVYGSGVNANLMVQAKDRAGAVRKIDYDASGRAVTITRGYALSDNNGNITQVLPGPSVETLAYVDGTSNVLTRTVDGKVTQYTYDYAHRLASSTTFPSQGKQLVSKTAYNANELPFVETNSHGCRTFTAYRASDQKPVRVVRELVPGALGSSFPSAPVIPVLLAPGSYGTSTPVPDTDTPILALTRDTNPNPAYEFTDYTLDGLGRTILETDPRGIQSATVYDAKGRVSSITKAIGTPQQQVMTMTYDAADRTLAKIDALNRTTSTAYFPSGRVQKLTYPDTKHVDYTYYADGKVASRTDEDGFTSNFTWSQCCGREFGSSNPQGQGTLKFYDGLGRVTYLVTVNDVASTSSSVIWGSGITLPSSAVVAAQTAQYDARGRLIASTRWNSVPTSVDPHNPPIASSGSAAGFTTTYVYFDDLSDARLAPVLTQLASQGVTLTVGSAVIITNPTGNQSFTVSDGAGREIASGNFN